ncbi:YqjF family protein [Priestia endophytica]|uniref:DUF2071 domain-containing protein n=1 Tax=Priestia endophytica DSM 13796 TaxID=1121089 RepID=A0A1I6C8N5_9BACI|nr:DUF2071 domain-containing protein [Priestia endophytica]KYG29064.1 hypothetical protein AZF06_25285 [Priestia endophytica]SFQ89504.1 hypothetical protein SAMN02745910_05291 [Priestia endophytica DSM 13796]
MNTSHRPFPPPRGPWIMSQTWNDVLFAHWEVSPRELRAKIPPMLDLDTYQEKAWISILPFYLTHLRARFLPPIPKVHSFPELNLRTYVSYKGRPGIYFFSLDASHPLAVLAARSFFHLPYYHAQMSFEKNQKAIHFWSQRKDNSQAKYEANYSPISLSSPAPIGSLDYWLTERYRLYTTFKNQLYYEDIHHKPWLLQKVEASLSIGEIISPRHIDLSGDPTLLHYAEKQKVRFWPIKKWKNGLKRKNY